MCAPRCRPTFYLDANISPRVAQIARVLGVDALALSEDPAVDHSADDDTVLQRATELGRRRYRGIVLVSPRIPGDGFRRMADLLADFAATQPDVEAYGFGSLDTKV